MELVNRIVNIISEKTVIFDFDGVLATYRSTKDKVHTNFNKYIGLHLDPIEAHKYARAPETVKLLVKYLNSNRVYVLSETATSFEQNNKSVFIQTNYPSIKLSNVMYVGKREYKLHLIKALEEKGMIPNRKDIIIIEDNLVTISELEDAGFSCLHISELVE